MIPIPKFILKKCLRPIQYDDMEFELKLKGPF